MEAKAIMASPDAVVTGQGKDVDRVPSRTHLNFVLIHEHRLFRHGLRLILEQLDERYVVVGEGSSDVEALEDCDGLEPGIVLLDLTWSDDFNRAEGIARVRTAHPDARVIVVAPVDSPIDVVQVIKAGANGYLTRASGTDDLVRAIETVEAGGSWIDPSLTPLVMDEYRKLATSGSMRRVERGDLSARDREMLQLLASGLSNRQIAERTRLAESTVKNNLSSLFRKLGVRDRTQAVLYAIDNGIAGSSAHRD